jgi:hypothetical protein
MEYNTHKASDLLKRLKQRWVSTPTSKGTKDTRAIVLRHLNALAVALAAAPHLALEPCGKPHGTFESSFVPVYTEQLKEGLSETAAKNVGAPRAFLAQMLANTPAINSHVNHQLERASASAQRWAENSDAGKYVMESLIAAQVEPNSREVDLGNGVKVSKMRVLVCWEGYGNTQIHLETGLTWKLVSQITDPNGAYRQHRKLLEAFIVDMLGTKSGSCKEWPFKRKGGSNDRDIVFASGVPDDLRSHITNDKSSKKKSA